MAVIPQPAGASPGMILHLDLASCDPTGACVILGDDAIPSGGLDVSVVASGSGSSWTSSLAPSAVPDSFTEGVIYEWLQCPAFEQCVAGAEVNYQVGSESDSVTYMLEDSMGLWTVASSSDPDSSAGHPFRARP